MAQLTHTESTTTGACLGSFRRFSFWCPVSSHGSFLLVFCVLPEVHVETIQGEPVLLLRQGLPDMLLFGPLIRSLLRRPFWGTGVPDTIPSLSQGYSLDLSRELAVLASLASRKYPQLLGWPFFSHSTFLPNEHLWDQLTLTPIPVAGLHFPIPQLAVVRRLRLWGVWFLGTALALSQNLRSAFGLAYPSGIH